MTIGMRYLLDCLRYGIPVEGAEGDAVYIDASATLVVTCPDGMGGVEVHRPARPALALGVLDEYDPSVDGLT